MLALIWWSVWFYFKTKFHHIFFELANNRIFGEITQARKTKNVPNKLRMMRVCRREIKLFCGNRWAVIKNKCSKKKFYTRFSAHLAWELCVKVLGNRKMKVIKKKWVNERKKNRSLSAFKLWNWVRVSTRCSWRKIALQSNAVLRCLIWYSIQCWCTIAFAHYIMNQFDSFMLEVFSHFFSLSVFYFFWIEK